MNYICIIILKTYKVNYYIIKRVCIVINNGLLMAITLMVSILMCSVSY